MNSINISKIDINTVEGNEDVLLGVIPMKMYYDTEFLKKIGTRPSYFRDEEFSMEVIFDELEHGYNFWVAKKLEEYRGFISGILRGDVYENTATFVYPNSRRQGIAKKMLEAQMIFARKLGAIQFKTGIDKTSVEVKKMVDELGFSTDKLPNGWDAIISL